MIRPTCYSCPHVKQQFECNLLLAFKFPSFPYSRRSLLFHTSHFIMMLHSLLSGALSALLLSGSTLAKPLSYPPSSSTKRDVSCGNNSPTNRACWKNNWDIHTDYETTVPTGVTRTVSLLSRPPALPRTDSRTVRPYRDQRDLVRPGRRREASLPHQW